MIPRKGISHLRLFFISVVLLFSTSDVFPKPIFIYTSEPVIRVSLTENVKNLSLHTDGNFKLNYQGIEIAKVNNSDVSFSFSHDGTPVAALANQEIEFLSPIKIEQADSTVVAGTISAGADGIKFNYQTYPGSMEIIPENDGTFRLVNFVPLEKYLRGVVPNELVNNLTPDELQACMAQAIAARNFAFYKMSEEDSTEFDVYSDTRDQVYSGMEKYKSLADSAIKLTSGTIVEYNGQPARCFFHSTCGGHTENVQHIWQGQPSLPYLTGVSDVDSTTGQPFCIYSPQFYWTSTYTERELDKLLRANLGLANPTYTGIKVKSNVSELKVLDRFDSFRVDTLEIKMENGEVYYVRGDRTRYLFKSTDGALLRSSLFRITTERNDDGNIKKVVIKGQGSGHGVGMCQWGALGMSRLGYSYLQILSHYYPGTVVKKVY